MDRLGIAVFNKILSFMFFSHVIFSEVFVCDKKYFLSASKNENRCSIFLLNSQTACNKEFQLKIAPNFIELFFVDFTLDIGHSLLICKPKVLSSKKTCPFDMKLSFPIKLSYNIPISLGCCGYSFGNPQENLFKDVFYYSFNKSNALSVGEFLVNLLGLVEKGDFIKVHETKKYPNKASQEWLKLFSLNLDPVLIPQ